MCIIFVMALYSAIKQTVWCKWFENQKKEKRKNEMNRNALCVLCRVMRSSYTFSMVQVQMNSNDQDFKMLITNAWHDVYDCIW